MPRHLLCYFPTARTFPKFPSPQQQQSRKTFVINVNSTSLVWERIIYYIYSCSYTTYIPQDAFMHTNVACEAFIYARLIDFPPALCMLHLFTFFFFVNCQNLFYFFAWRAPPGETMDYIILYTGEMTFEISMRENFFDARICADELAKINYQRKTIRILYIVFELVRWIYCVSRFTADCVSYIY